MIFWQLSFEQYTLAYYPCTNSPKLPALALTSSSAGLCADAAGDVCVDENNEVVISARTCGVPSLAHPKSLFL